MIPGEIMVAAGEIVLNADRQPLTLKVANTGDRPVQVGSHYHFSETNEALAAGRRRLVYQELLVLQLAIAIRRWSHQQNRTAPKLEATAKIDARIRRLFPFELTEDQCQSIEEVKADMAFDVPMNRLLQGDVGTGKTVVAMYALLLAVAHGRQAALMAPTEVLARQHARTLERSLAESRVRIGLLTGSLSPAKRAKLLEKIAAGEIDLVIGTHAIANAMMKADESQDEDRFPFANLGLVIVDEQHKFGVKQRAALKPAGAEPHWLVMSATPIPRTMSMTLFGAVAESCTLMYSEGYLWKRVAC